MGWQLIHVEDGRTAMRYNLYNNPNRTVAFNPKTGRPEDKAFQTEARRVPAQAHF